MPDLVTGEVSAYINAGGRGTRLESVLPADPDIGISKALLPLGSLNEPAIAYHIKRYLNLRFRNIIVSCGDHEPVVDYVHDTFGNIPEVTPITTFPQSGTGGDLLAAIRSARELFCETTLVTNCDTLLDIDERSLLAHHRALEADATIALTTAQGVPNEGAFLVSSYGVVLHNAEADTVYKKPKPPRGAYFASSCGMVALQTEVFEQTARTGDFSIYRHFLGDASTDGKLVAFNNGENFFMDIGLPTTYNFIKQNPAIIEDLLTKTLHTKTNIEERTT